MSINLLLPSRSRGTLGQHNEAVLRRLGYDDSKIERLLPAMTAAGGPKNAKDSS
jgi:crotonobetainyl-CoA:carnitine CoA-transferase CaiB-like acyl-CoA transferase